MSEHPEQANETRQLMEQAARVYPPPSWLTWAAFACLVIGIITFIVGLAAAPAVTWGSYLANFLFWTGISQGSVVAAAIYVIAPARWGRIVQRIGIGLAAFLPFTWILLLVLWLGRRSLWVWTFAPITKPWLTPPILFGRDLLILLVTGGLSLWFVYLSLRRDMGDAGVRRAGGSFTAWLAAGWRGEEEEQRRSARLMHNLSPAIILTYAYGYSFLAIDLAMSMAPDFHSTMFPGIYFLGEYFAALAASAILVAFWRRNAPVERLIPWRYSQDLANLTWAFAIFEAYVLWSQYIVVWYGNLPHEAGYFAQRSRVFPWSAFAWAAIFASFLVPFLFLFNRPIKRHPPWLAAICAIGLLGVLLWRFLDVLPFLPFPGPGTFGLVPVGMTIGFVGAVMLPYLWLMRRVPLFPVEDPVFFEAVATRNVEET